jgi:lipopolysaccharide export system permease protein
MIGIADRHLGFNAIGGILLALLVLVALDAFFALIRELSDLGKGDYQVGHALWYVVLTLPARAYNLFPTAGVVGALLGVGGLAASSELVAYRAAGMSRMRISATVAIATLLLLTPILLVGESVGPSAERLAQSIRVRAQSGNMAIAKGTGLWVRDGETIINARRPLISSVAPGQFVKLAEVEVFEFDQSELRNVAHAELGEHDGEQWILHQVSRSRFAGGRVLVETVESEKWPSLLDPELLRTAITHPRELALTELIPYVRYLDDNGLDAAAYRAALWWRLTYPLSVIAIVLAAMPFVFGTLRSGGLGQRMFVGMLLEIGFYFVNRTAGSLGEVYSLNPAMTALLPSSLLLVLTLMVLRRGT